MTPHVGDVAARSSVERALSRRPALTLLIPVGIAVLIHGRSVGFPFVGFDDPMHCTSNPLVASPLSAGWLELFLTRSIGYPIPVTVASYAIDHAIVGFAPWWFHLVNVALHGANVALVVGLARQLGSSRWASTLAGTWFAAHPLVVEPVSWVTGRKDLLSTCFALLALTLVAGRARERVSWRGWAVATALALVAMLAKTTAVVVPVMLWLASRHRVDLGERRRMWAATAVGLTLSAAVLATGISIVRQQQALGSVGLSDRALSVAGAWTLSLQHSLVPVDLHPYYFQWNDDPAPWAMALAACVAVALVVGCWRGLPAGSAERVGFSWAAAAYLPVSGIVGHHRWTADSYLYLCLTGVCVGGAALLERTLAFRSVTTRFSLGLAVALALAPASLAQAEVWKHPEMIWKTVSKRYPQSPVALSELAATLDWLGRAEESVQTYAMLDERFPDFEQKLLPRANARLVQGNMERALQILHLGLVQGDREVAAAYLRWLLENPGAEAVPVDLRRAFELAWPDFSHSVQDPAVYAHLVNRLARADLASEARVVAARHEALMNPTGRSHMQVVSPPARKAR
ncbi:MAG: glycosyltransferase family 39 protein [Polyangiaceae bacterium]|nr:glycosyltransferase family 39 protein [Polyangiaceae bacterium]